MNDYFFIDQENMPCIYELSFDAKSPAIVIRAHNEFMDRWPKFLGEAPIVTGLMKQFGFSAFKDGYKGDFGFNSAFKRIADDGEFAVFSAQIPVVQKVAEKVCPLCGGDKKSLFDSKPAFAVSASFTLFFELAGFKMEKHEATPCRFPQLILVNTITQQNSHGGSLDGTYGIPLAKWLSSFPENTEIPEMTEAMVLAWEKMFRKVDEYDRHNFYAKVANENGWLNVSCSGDRCGLHPVDSWGPKSGRGYKFSCHNVDTPAQQITLLAGLAALCDKAKKEINIC